MTRILPNGLAVIDEDMPDFLRMTPEERNEAWQRKPPKPTPQLLAPTHRSKEAEEEYQRIIRTREIEKMEKRDRALAILKVKAEPMIAARRAAKAALPKPGHDTIIKVLRPNARKSGTKAAARFDAMEAFVKANPSATLADVYASTIYGRGDYEWDLRHKNITSDLRRQSSTEADRNRQK